MRATISIALIASLGAVTHASAQDWPTRPVTMVVPFAAGGAGDVLGRILAPRLSDLLGQTVIVESAGGAGGMIGSARVAKAAPDGYQFLLGNTGTHAHNQWLHKNPPYNAATDFTPVALVAEQPTILITRPDLPVGTLQEFIAYAKRHQAQMQYGSAGVGSATHLACSLLTAAIGVDVTHVPYRSGPAATQDLIAGRLDYQCVNSAPAIPHIAAKAVKPIAILSRLRSATLPDLPSAHEQGLHDFEAVTWNAFFLPKGTPAPVVQRLHAATVAAMNTPAVASRLKEVGADLVAPERRSPEYLGAFVKREIDKWAGPIKAAGMGTH